MYIISILDLIKIILYLSSKVLIALLNIKKVNIFTKYLKFIDNFLSNIIIELINYFSISNYFIIIIDNK